VGLARGREHPFDRRGFAAWSVSATKWSATVSGAAGRLGSRCAVHQASNARQSLAYARRIASPGSPLRSSWPTANLALGALRDIAETARELVHVLSLASG
jgi:hypothetical protein